MPARKLVTLKPVRASEAVGRNACQQTGQNWTISVAPKISDHKQVQESQITLKTYSGSLANIRGQTEVELRFLWPGQKETITARDNRLGRDWIEEIPVPLWATAHNHSRLYWWSQSSWCDRGAANCASSTWSVETLNIQGTDVPNWLRTKRLFQSLTCGLRYKSQSGQVSEQDVKPRYRSRGLFLITYLPYRGSRQTKQR